MCTIYGTEAFVLKREVVFLYRIRKVLVFHVPAPILSGSDNGIEESLTVPPLRSAFKYIALHISFSFVHKRITLQL